MSENPHTILVPLGRFLGQPPPWFSEALAALEQQGVVGLWRGGSFTRTSTLSQREGVVVRSGF